MSDEAVHDGIKAMLELDRCREEEERLIQECHTLQIWFSEEWVIIEQAIQTAERLGIVLQLIIFNDTNNYLDDQALEYSLQLQKKWGRH